MNCEEFRRKLYEDPGCRDPDFLAHRGGCESCDREAGEVQRLEADLRKLLRAPTPRDLKSRLRRPPPIRRCGWLPAAMAASLAGLVAVGAWWWGAGAGNGAGIVAEVLQHIEREPQALDPGGPLAADVWQAVSSRVRLDTADWYYAVTYAAPCELMRQPGLHLVLQAEGGPVTVLVIVDRQVAEARMFSDDHNRGVIRPLEHGAVAVVGPDGRAVDELAAELAKRIRISI